VLGVTVALRIALATITFKPNAGGLAMAMDFSGVLLLCAAGYYVEKAIRRILTQKDDTADELQGLRLEIVMLKGDIADLKAGPRYALPYTSSYPIGSTSTGLHKSDGICSSSAPSRYSI
jgi:hypothetical protein